MQLKSMAVIAYYLSSGVYRFQFAAAVKLRFLLSIGQETWSPISSTNRGTQPLSITSSIGGSAAVSRQKLLLNMVLSPSLWSCLLLKNMICKSWLTIPYSLLIAVNFLYYPYILHSNKHYQSTVLIERATHPFLISLAVRYCVILLLSLDYSRSQ